MEILIGIVVAVVALVLIGRLSGDGGASYEEYRRAEYRNEYLWESKQRRNDNYFIETATLRRP